MSVPEFWVTTDGGLESTDAPLVEVDPFRVVDLGDERCVVCCSDPLVVTTAGGDDVCSRCGTVVRFDTDGIVHLFRRSYR